MYNHNANNGESLKHLSEVEKDFVRRYFTIVSNSLEDNLHEIWLYGFCAHGDIWGQKSPMHSDIDVLFLAAARLEDGVIESLVNETYPLFLEFGWQISPRFQTCASFYESSEKRSRDFRDRVVDEDKLFFGFGDLSS